MPYPAQMTRMLHWPVSTEQTIASGTQTEGYASNSSNITSKVLATLA